MGVFDPGSSIRDRRSFTIRPADDFHQFRDLAALIGLVTAVDGVFHAVGDVILQDFFFYTTKRGTHG